MSVTPGQGKWVHTVPCGCRNNGHSCARWEPDPPAEVLLPIDYDVEEGNKPHPELPNGLASKWHVLKPYMRWKLNWAASQAKHFRDYIDAENRSAIGLSPRSPS